jgi:hypothetical protein
VIPVFLFFLDRGRRWERSVHASFLLNVDRERVNSISLFPNSVNDIDVRALLFRQRNRCALRRLPVGIVAVSYDNFER